MKYVTGIYVALLAALWLLATYDIRPWEIVFDRVPMGDKVCHFLLVGILSFLLNITHGPARRASGMVAISGVSMLLIAAVTVEEGSQLLVATRTFSLADLACNYAGIVSFGLLAGLLGRLARHEQSTRPPGLAGLVEQSDA